MGRARIFEFCRCDISYPTLERAETPDESLSDQGEKSYPDCEAGRKRVIFEFA
jgi:hypothetical protein